jgi:hypothetical protein
MVNRYFLVHGLATGGFESSAVSLHRPWLAAVIKLDHFPRLDELRFALARECEIDAAHLRITGWSEVTKEEARVYMDNGDAQERAAITAPRYTMENECVLL